ncbi:MAG TPA: Rossmann-like and DUF2520 domain-containing protein [Bryobacteraceae bacterium]|jgi:predicted short-subunit dehydrogenase-like oxidoreductase (DUF2520 family)
MTLSTAPVAIAGAGRLGPALGLLLRERGVPIAAIAGRNPERAAQAARFIGGGAKPVPLSELPSYAARILIAVPDDAIEPVATLLADAGISPGSFAIHTSGARGPEALARLEDRGVSCAAMHPLQTVTTPQQGLSSLPGSSYGISGSGKALSDGALGWALEIVALIEGKPLMIDAAMRPLYHAAAVMASNYIVALIDSAVILMGEAGVEPEEALRALAPLIRASAENTLEAGPTHALTGPIQRGDSGTVLAHLQALAGVPQAVRELYRRAGLHAAEIAERKGPRRGEIKLVLREGTGE